MSEFIRFVDIGVHQGYSESRIEDYPEEVKEDNVEVVQEKEEIKKDKKDNKKKEEEEVTPQRPFSIEGVQTYCKIVFSLEQPVFPILTEPNKRVVYTTKRSLTEVSDE